MQFLRLLYLLLFFVLPLSVENLSLGFGINVPGEPIQCLIVFVLLFYWEDLWVIAKSSYKNPLFVFIGVYMLWSWVSCTYSDMPVVSAKFTLIETIHVLVFVAGAVLVQKKYPRFFVQCILAYTLSFLPLLLHAWYLHAHYNFALDFSAAAMRPFYRDHPLYGSAIAFLIPLWLYLYFKREDLPVFMQNKAVAAFITVLLLIGLFLSFSRASWLTVFIGAALTGFIYLFRQNVRKLGIALSALLVVLATAIILLVSVSQKKELVKNTTVANQFMSSFNWSYDVANLERLNRYKCAWRMFMEKPFTGFGNNMYKFSYLAYQKQEDMTRISLNAALPEARNGTGGNSHSDYLAALTELGLPGLLFWCGIVFSALLLSCRLYLKEQKVIFLFIFFSLVTYFLHVTVNNFLHDDKISGLMWLCCAAILAAVKGVPEIKMNPGRPL